MLPKKMKLLYLWKIYGDVLCVLDCIVGNVPFFFSKCAVSGDSVAVLEKSRGFFFCSALLKQEDIQELRGR